MDKFMEEKVIREEETILRSGMSASSLYGDRTFAYITPSGRCWLDWRENRHRYVWRLGYILWRTGLLLTSTYGQVCYEELTRSDAPSDKTVKALICLLVDVSPHSELQLGRVNAVCGRHHRMLMIGLSIDDYEEDLGDDGVPTMLEVADEGSKMEEVDCREFAETLLSATFSALREVYFVAVRGQPRNGWRGHEVSESMDLAPRG